MVGPFRGVPYGFGALREIYGPLFVRCDVCRRYARLYLADTETGMTDYRLDQVEGPQHHPGALARLTGPPEAAYRLSAKHVKGRPTR
jgi:hypothetical protein